MYVLPVLVTAGAAKPPKAPVYFCKLPAEAEGAGEEAGLEEEAIGPALEVEEEATGAFEVTMGAADEVTTGLVEDVTIGFAEEVTTGLADEVTTGFAEEVTTGLAELEGTTALELDTGALDEAGATEVTGAAPDALEISSTLPRRR